MSTGLGIGVNSIVSGASMFDEVKSRKLNTGTVLPPQNKQPVLDSVLDRQPTQENQLTPSGTPAPTPASPDKAPEKAAPNPEFEAFNKKLEEIERRNEQLNKDNQALRSNYDRVQGNLQYLTQQAQQARQPVQQEIAMPEIDDPDLRAALQAVEQRTMQKVQGSLNETQRLNNDYLQRQQKAMFQSAVEQVRRAEPSFTKYFTDDELMQFAQPYITNPRFIDVDWNKEIQLAFKVKNHDDLKAENADLKKRLEQFEKKEQGNKEAQKKNLSMVPSGIGGGASQTANNATSAAERVLSGFRNKGIRASTRDKFRAIRREMGIAV